MSTVMTTKSAVSNQAQELDLFGEPVGGGPEAQKSPSVPSERATKPAAESPIKQKVVDKTPNSVATKTAPTVKKTKVVSKKMDSSQYPVVPEKRYFTISEAGELCGVKPHVLRYWESEFKQLSPVKRAGNRRYYQRQDIFLIREIRELLHEQGFTISGARQKLTGENTKEEVTKNKQILREVRQGLEDILKGLKVS